MRKVFFLTAFFIISLFSPVISQDEWVSYEYQTGNTGESGLVGQYVYCFLNDSENRLWIGTASGISIKTESNWESITTNEGLRVDEVGDFVMDNDNNIWISYGSYLAGISMYDGESFTHYTSSNGLNHDKVDDILKDKEGNLWFATYGGLSKFDGINWTGYSTDDGLPTDTIMSLAEDLNGNIWIGTARRGTWIFDGENFTEMYWESNSDDWIRKIFVDSEGKVWIAGNGVHIYNNNTWTTIDPPGLTWDIIEDQDGKFFFGTSVGVSLYSNSEWTDFTTDDGLPNNNNFSLYVDGDNIVYSGSERGYATYDGSSWEALSTEGLINNKVNDIFKDSDNKIWFCTHGGISILDGEKWESFFTTPSGDNVEWVSKGIQDASGEYWFTTVHGILHYDGENWTLLNYETDEIFSGWGQDILEDKEGKLWFATWNYLLMYDGESWTHYNETDGFLSKYIEALYQDSEGTIWFGTRGGISNWNGTEFSHNTIDNSEFEGSAIYSFIEDTSNNIIASTSEGLLILKDGAWNYMDNSPRLWFLDSYKCKNEILWFASIDGLYKYDSDTFYTYLEEDGLISKIVKQIYREEDTGIFWFATENGVSKLVPGIRASISNNKSTNEGASIQIMTEGITKPFQFSSDGVNFEKNDGLFQELSDGIYTFYVTNAYDTLSINHTIGEVGTYIDEYNSLKIKVFPNPSNGKFFFSGEKPEKIEIFNLNGQKVISKSVTESDNYIDLAEFEDGIYIITFINKERIYRTNLLKIDN